MAPTRPRITYIKSLFGSPWNCWIPPRGPEDFDGDDILAPYGDTHWKTHDEAFRFVERVSLGDNYGWILSDRREE